MWSRKLAQRGQRGRGSTGIPGAWRKVWLQCTDKCLDHQALANAECRKEDNLGQECLPRQAAEVQLARYYCSAQRYTEVAHIDIAGPVDQNILTTEVEKVERYQNLALKSKRINSHESDNTTHCDRYAISKNEKGLVWEVTLLNSFGRA